MSIEMMTLAWGIEIPATEKIVLLKIADGSGDDGSFSINQKATYIACGVNERDFSGCIFRLQEEGVISITAFTNSPSGNVMAHGKLNLGSRRTFRAKND